MDKVVILLRQHVGKPCRPIIEVGEEVKRGQKIAEPDGLGAVIHSSVTGTVKEVTEASVVIEYDEANFQTEEYMPIKETANFLEAIAEAGIVGAGGAGFPTHIKYSKPLPGGYVIANAAECEPLLAHNMEYIEHDADHLVRGMGYLLQISQAAKAYIAIKPKHKMEVVALMKAIRNNPQVAVELKFLPDLYPAGDERVIIRELLDIRLEPGQLPSVANAVISNVETVKRIVDAIEKRKPFIDKDVTVGGAVQDHSHVFLDVPVGTSLGKMIAKAGGFAEQHGEIVAGGPFTGKHSTEEAPITKTTGGVLVSIPFPKETRKVGIICCECGAQEERLREIAQGMGAEVIAAERCKRMVEVGGRYRCELPGICPGQAETVFKLKKQGAEVVLTGTCQDWTNTVVGVAPRLGVPVYHSTDHVLRAAGHKLYRKLPDEKP